MKNNLTTRLFLASCVLFATSCDLTKKEQEKKADQEETTATEENYSYTFSVVHDASKVNAPDLQSFAHGAIGADWVMFSGRTNSGDTKDGGLHDIPNGNYANTSFKPKSFNQDIIVYNIDEDKTWRLNVSEFLNQLGNQMPEKVTTGLAGMNLYNAFVNSNPLVTQDANGFLYSVGGYGSIANQDKQATFMTFGQIIRIHLPSMIKLVKGETLSKEEWEMIFRYGQDDGLMSTGAELFIIDDTYYIAGGHNFGTSANFFHGQKYVDAVYPFTLEENENSLLLNVVMGDPISDVANPKDTISDDSSKFRRRDGPVTASVFKNAAGNLVEGFTFFGGVFKPGSDKNLEAWNTAIYIHPDGASKYEIDPTYNQGDYNVYACADFTGYDSDKDIMHTFLMGGIGSGEISIPSRLSSFTNTGLYIQTNLAGSPSSSMSVVDDIFNSGDKAYYGAESIMHLMESLPRVAVADGSSEVIDLKAAFEGSSEIEIGYIHGGIEAFQKDPGTYGSGNSAASKKVWKVTLQKVPFVKE